jgi:hypothetical protein
LSPAFVTRETLRELFDAVERLLQASARVYLVGETSATWEGWRPWTDCVVLSTRSAPASQAAVDEALQRAATDIGVAVVQESPADVIPLPAGHETRARPAERIGERLHVFHFDPYSQSFRFLARGDERDYDLVLAFLEHGWVTVDDMDALLRDLIVQFSMETIQQDADEFRRRYRGLVQMWRARRPPQRTLSDGDAQ